jgi:hypothetical protein
VIEEVGKVVERGVEVMANGACRLFPHAQIQEQGEQEDRVDDRRRRREEVVVVQRDELAHLVDEQADPDPGEHGAGPERPSVGEQQRAQRRAEQEQPAPQDMRDVQLAAAQLGIAGRRERRAHHDHRQGEPDQGATQIALGPEALYRAVIRHEASFHAHLLDARPTDAPPGKPRRRLCARIGW